MPIREYMCNQCGSSKERIEYQSKVYGAMECDKCSSRMNRMLSKSDFILKGDGWYGKGNN